MILSLLAALFGAAQKNFVVFEGAESTHLVTDHPGSNYSWKVMIDFSPDTEANSADYEFTTPNGIHQIGVRWNKAGLYYLDVMETDVSGCANRKVIVVNVLTNNRSIAFNAALSSACFNEQGNGFGLPLRILDDGGIPLASADFPVDIGFTVNGTTFIKQIVYDQQVLYIDVGWFTVDPQQETIVLVQLNSASDKQGVSIPVVNGDDLHTRSIHATPQLQFVFSDTPVYELYYGNYEVGLTVGDKQNATYHWMVDPPEGTSTNLTVVDTEIAEILWDGPPGFYSLNVSAIDGNGCYSDTISRLIEIRKPDTIPFEVYAGPDTLIGSCDFYLFAEVSPNDESYTYSWEPATNLDDPGIMNPLFIPGETTTYVLTVTTITGVTAKDTVTISVEDVVADAGDNVYMESGSTVMLDGSGSIGTGLNYRWTSLTGNIESGENTPNPIVSNYGTYYLEVTYDSNCVSVDSVTVIRLAHVPVANNDYDTTNFMTKINIPVLENDFDVENSIDSTTLTITLPPFNGTAYVDFNDYTIHYQANQGFNGTDNFEYQICNKFNNCDNASVYVWVTDSEFLIPEAFSPNGDGINDYFEILGIEYFENNSITIINRWGNKVYEARSYGIKTDPEFWDGKSNTGYRIGNEELPTGNYFYVLDLGNGNKPISGSIYLDR